MKIEKRYAYLRESTNKQITQEKNGLPAQERDILCWLKCNDIDPDTVEFAIDAGKSGKDIHRPMYQKIVRDLMNPSVKVSLIITQTDDRLMRNLNETIKFMDILEEHPETKLVILNGFMSYESATNKYITHSKASANQFWIDKTSEDTINRMKAAAYRGRYVVPGCPIGFIKDPVTKKLSLNLDQYDILQDLGEKIASNEYGIESLLRYCRANKILDIKWTYEKLNGLLSNPISNGVFYWKKQEFLIADHSPKLYDNDLWTKIQVARERRKADTRHRYLFKYKVYCKNCGNQCSHSCTIRPYTTYKYYWCESCKKRINENSIIKELLPVLENKLNENEKEKVQQSLDRKIKKIDKLLKHLSNDFIESLIEEEEYQAEKRNYLLKRAELKGELRELKDIKKINFNKSDYNTKKEIIRNYIDKIYIDFTEQNTIEFYEKENQDKKMH